MMILLRTTLFFLLLLLLPDWYIYRTFVRPFRLRWLTWLHWSPSIALLLAMGAFLAAHDALADYFGMFLTVALCVAVPKAVFALCGILAAACSRFLLCPLRHIAFKAGMAAGLLLAVCSLGTLIYGATEGKQHFRVKEVEFASPDLPGAFDGYRILQISDLHTGSWQGNAAPLQRVVDICNGLKPDVTVFTGDLVNSLASEMTEFMPVLSQLHAPDGVYSILGNHDYATYATWDSEADRLANIDTLLAREARMGWQMLMNDHRILHRGNDSIALAGVENSGNPPFPDRGDLPKALRGTEGLFTVLLSHDPTHWRRNVLPETDVQLMLAGHTHDMQFSLFGFSPAQFIYPEHRGMYREGSRGLYVNVGLGHVLFPMRIGAWPEITVITLRKQ